MTTPPKLPAVSQYGGQPCVYITGCYTGIPGRVTIDEHGTYRTINAWSDPENADQARERAAAYLALANHQDAITE